MGATERIVRHLSLRAGSEAEARRAALKLEDALRCASLPDAGTRVLLIRRLDLGRFAPDASPQTLSRRIEQTLAAAGGTWQHAAEADASAGFVFFHDALEARCLLALRLASAASCTAWFWPQAVAEFTPALDTPGNLRRIAQTIAGWVEAPAAIPAWIARLTVAGVAPVVARALTAADALLLLKAACLPIAKFRAAAADVAPPRHADGSPSAAGVAEPDSAVPLNSPSRRLTSSHLPDAPYAELPAWWLALAAAGGFIVDAPPVVATPDTDRQTQAPPMTGVETYSGRPGREAEPATVAHEVPDGPGRATTSAAPPHLTPQSAAAYGMQHAAFTHYGGLLFMLTLLQRLAFAAWTEDLPQDAGAPIAREMLRLILQRLHAPADDPAWRLTVASYDDPVTDILARMPAGWDDPALAPPRGVKARHLTSVAAHPQTVAALAQLWLSACRRWLRRRAGIGVASLVARPAALSLNATHADVYFQLNATDLRVRRAGLDVDPGWVAWFGRVVTFHYTELSITPALSTAAGSNAGSNHGR